MSHTEIMLFESALRAMWYAGDGRAPIAHALYVSQSWPKGRRYIRSEKV